MTSLQDHYDVIVVGAGLSGIDAGYRLQTMCPDKDYVILEARASLGGTWDLFKYPGVRSDSDMFTLGLPFEPWQGAKSIAPGAEILGYLKDTARKYGIDERIAFNTKVIAADWSSADATWTVRVSTPEGERTVTSSFVYLCSGYYNYDQPYDARFAGREDFAGDIVHPQFWPENFEAAGKKVVVIGSGATAMTLVPALADRGAHVTMLQRSPTYVISLPDEDPFAALLRKRLSPQRAYGIVRMKNAAQSHAFYLFTRKAPKAAAAILRRGAKSLLKPGAHADIGDFTPRYNPWDQRLCVVPGGDLFEAINSGRAEVVTDVIDRFVPEGVRTASGKVIEADVIVTATGLAMVAAGGAQLSVDGRPVDLGSRHIYRGMMLEGVPNAAMCVGYTNASWTLRADLSSQYFATFVNYLDAHGYAFGYPVPDRVMPERPALDLTAGYVQRSMKDFPKQGDADPWLMHQSFFKDRSDMRKADVSEQMRFFRPGEVRSPNEDVHEPAA